MVTTIRVVVVGAGFGGVRLVQSLAKDPSFQIVLIDKRNHHLFQPLLYQVATAGLSPADIAAPIRSLFSHNENVQVILDEVRSVDRVNRCVLGSDTEFPYDVLVLACGATDTYFAHPEWEAVAPGLKTLEQATDIRTRILLAFEEAEKEKDADVLRAWMTFGIVGGGPTGVELAGAIAELSRFTLSRDFRHINPRLARVVLMEGGMRILPSFHADLAERARGDLERMGVQVWCGSRVTEVNKDGVRFGQDWLATRTVFWAAGVRASPIGKNLFPENTDKQGRLPVDEYLNFQKDKSVFVIGDLALRMEGGRPLPGVAPVAIQQGLFVAQHLKDQAHGRKSKPFRYRDKGSLATIGRNRAVLERGSVRLSGRFAWFLWLVIHIYYLIGFKNRIAVFLQWSWAYITFQRGARLITVTNTDRKDIK